jgi:hypothetical protein
MSSSSIRFHPCSFLLRCLLFCNASFPHIFSPCFISCSQPSSFPPSFFFFNPSPSLFSLFRTFFSHAFPFLPYHLPCFSVLFPTLCFYGLPFLLNLHLPIGFLSLSSLISISSSTFLRPLSTTYFFFFVTHYSLL